MVVLTVLLPGSGRSSPAACWPSRPRSARRRSILAPFAYLAWKVVPRLLLRVARTGNDELFLMVALAHRARHGGPDPGGRALAGARRVPGRPAHQQLRLRARDAGPPAARARHLRGASSSSPSARSSTRRTVVGQPAAAGRDHRPRGRRQARDLDAASSGCSATRCARRSWSAWASRRSGSSRSSSSRSRAGPGHVGRRRLQRDAGRLADHDPDQRHARAAGAALGRAPRGAAGVRRAGDRTRATWCCAASAASAARSARRSTPSAVPYAVVERDPGHRDPGAAGARAVVPLRRREPGRGMLRGRRRRARPRW